MPRRRLPVRPKLAGTDYTLQKGAIVVRKKVEIDDGTPTEVAVTIPITRHHRWLARQHHLAAADMAYADYLLRVARDAIAGFEGHTGGSAATRAFDHLIERFHRGEFTEEPKAPAPAHGRAPRVR